MLHQYSEFLPHNSKIQLYIDFIFNQLFISPISIKIKYIYYKKNDFNSLLKISGFINRR